jgi:cytochrome c-type biogenesis protein CcmH
MALWFVLSLMTATAIFAVLWPLSRRPNTSADASDVAVYRDQFAEVDRDLAGGQIQPAEAAAAKTEVARRLIAAADASRACTEPAPAAEQTSRRRAVVLAVLVLLPLGAAAFYAAMGSPMLPDYPVALRGGSSSDQSIDQLIAQVEQHLATHPEDGRGWEVIAPVYLRMGRFDDAVKARRNALRLNSETADRAASLGEALVFASNGVVTADAKASFERAIALDEGHVLARYYLGVAAEQEGDKAGAASNWRALLASAPAGAPWADFVQAAIDRVEGSGAAKQASSGPSEEQLAAAADLGPEQRNAMVLAMVERLAERLRRDGSDVEGWVRLVRSYLVLGKAQNARAAAVDGRRALAGEPEKLRRFDELLRGLGVEG